MKQFCCLPHVSSLIRTKVCRKGKRKVSLIPSFNWLNKKEIRGEAGEHHREDERLKRCNNKVRQSIKVEKIDDKGKSDSSALYSSLWFHTRTKSFGDVSSFSHFFCIYSVLFCSAVSPIWERECCPERSQLHSQLYKSPQHVQTVANQPITPLWHTGSDKEGPGQWDHRPDKRPFNEVAHKTGQNRAPHLRIPSCRCPCISSCSAATAGTAGERESQRKRGRVREKWLCALTLLSPPPKAPFRLLAEQKHLLPYCAVQPPLNTHILQSGKEPRRS